MAVVAVNPGRSYSHSLEGPSIQSKGKWKWSPPEWSQVLRVAAQ